MLVKPDLKDTSIITCLKNEYGLPVDKIAFLPLGADVNTAVYRAKTNNQTAYFVKLRRGNFNEASVAVPKYLNDLGVKQIIPPLPTHTGHLWADLETYKLILYPFVEGRNGFEVDLSAQQRIEFGTALKQLHTATIPTALTSCIQHERFSPQFREAVKAILVQIEAERFADPLARELAAFLSAKQNEIVDLIKRAEHFALALQGQPPEFILCHADIHGWNLLLGNDNSLYMVDWDTLIFAPKERDLMFIGCGLGGHGKTLQEETLFYQGYGATQINPMSIAYYRYERIIEDIAAFCNQFFSSQYGEEDRKRAFETLKANFCANNTIDIARQLDKTQYDTGLNLEGFLAKSGSK